MYFIPSVCEAPGSIPVLVQEQAEETNQVQKSEGGCVNETFISFSFCNGRLNHMKGFLSINIQEIFNNPQTF